VAVVKLDTRAETPRHRRLEPGEEDGLLRHAGDHLRALIAALLSTGCRVGELLSLQWKQVRRDEAAVPRWIVLPPTNTKTYKLRVIPIGARLRAELEMREHAPDGTPFGPEAYVFGNAAGEKVSTVKTAWGLRADEPMSKTFRSVTCVASSVLGCGSQGHRITTCETFSDTQTFRRRAGISLAHRCGWNRPWLTLNLETVAHP